MEFSEEYTKEWNSYLYPNTDTLINKLEIKDHDELAEKDKEISFEKLVDLYINPIEGNFDAKHLKDIHRFLFSDLYEWAGEYRTVYMTKKDTYFAEVKDIETNLEEVLSALKERVKSVGSKFELADVLAEYYINVQHVHPFREGNSRTIREFFRQFVLEITPLLSTGPLELDLTEFDKEVIATARETMAKYFKYPIVEQFNKALKKPEEIKNDQRRNRI